MRIALILTTCLVFLTGCSAKPAGQNSEAAETTTSLAVLSQPEQPAQPQPAQPAATDPFTARFQIYTNGTKRVFTQAMYHRQSPTAYIDNPDPSLIQVDQPPVTWADFFASLPFSLTKECLVTGDNQTFCTTANKKLQFLLNDVETPDALDLPIQPGDFLKVVYGE